jgi:anti-sigma factor RsiW
VTCEPERVTGFVDTALDPEGQTALAGHLEDCPDCRRQADQERALRARLRELPAVALPPGVEAAVRRRLRRSGRVNILPWLLPVAATLALAIFWGRGFGPFVAWEVAVEHDHCWGKPRLPATVFSNDPSVVAAFFEQQGTVLPGLPEGAGGLELIGARPCRLLDRPVAHVYYSNEERQLSIFVIPGSVRVDRSLRAKRGHDTILLMRHGDSLLGLVSDDPASVDAFAGALSVSFAQSQP